MKYLVIDPTAGSDVKDVIKDCCEVASWLKVHILIKNFNGVDITVTPTTTPEGAFAEFEAELDRRATEYEATPAYKEQLEASKKQLETSQKLVNALVFSLMSLLAKPRHDDYIIQWLMDFAKFSDHVDIECDFRQVANKLKSCGFKKNAHITLDKEAVKRWDRKTHAEYIVGQAISCLENNMPPHPMLISFCKQYLAEKS